MYAMCICMLYMVPQVDYTLSSTERCKLIFYLGSINGLFTISFNILEIKLKIL